MIEMVKNPAYQVDVKHSVELLKQLLHQVDEATWLILAGNLSQFRDRALVEVTREAIPVANELYSASYGRVYIPLTGENKFGLKVEVLPLVGMRTYIQEVLLQRYGHLLFAAYDCFQNGALLSDWFRPEFVEDLEQTGIIRVVQASPQACLVGV